MYRRDDLGGIIAIIMLMGGLMLLALWPLALAVFIIKLIIEHYKSKKKKRLEYEKTPEGQQELYLKTVATKKANDVFSTIAGIVLFIAWIVVPIIALLMK